MRERRGERRDRLVAARVVVGMRDHAQLAAGRRVVHADAEQVRREPVRELDRPLGERRLRVALEPDRALRAQRRVALERHHHVGGRDALAGQQVADEPRARQLARDVVLEVGVQAAVARVELRRRADREHGGVEQVEPERRGDLREPVVGVGDRVAAAQLERAVVGDVEAAERVGRVGVGRRDALDRGHHAAVDEVEADADRRARRHRVSGSDRRPSRPRAPSRRRAATRRAGRSRWRRAAGRRARARARSACRRTPSRGCTRRCAK